MTAPAPRRGAGVARDLAISAACILAPALAAAVAAHLLAGGSASGAAVAGAAAILLAVVAIRFVSTMRVRHGEARYRAIFERAGISMWREDWTAVAESVAELRRAGVADMESHFAARPDELRALKAKVFIKDVNGFTLEETGASGKEAYVGPLSRLLPDTDQTFVQWLVAFARGDRFFRSEAHVIAADGTERDTLFTAMLPGNVAEFADIVVTSLDITHYRQAQAGLMTAEADAARNSRIATANALTASIAHEVNSPLAAILANAQAAQRLLRPAALDVEEVGAALRDIVSQATRARDVVARLTAHFNRSPPQVSPVDVVHAARTANMLVEADLRRLGAVVHLAVEEDLPSVAADLIQVQQVFVNLLLNAAQAMAGRQGACDITVSMRGADEAVVVEVADNGPGVPAESRARIFEPFHSTRSDGMGLGLAICRNFVEAHGGEIRVDTAPGGGALFTFTLPIAAD
ncbi:sensor histidine kinase [Methylobrevis pamukkalensis]|nr:ATP-binding protein [Methylobrevis pamukkalensis]